MGRGTGYKYSISIELKNGARHLKEHPKVSKFTKFESYWFKRKGMVHFLPPFSLIRDFSNRNTRWYVSKISVNHTRHTIYGSVNTSTRDGKMADSTDSFEFTSQYSEMFEDRSVELPDLEETQIWDSPNVTVSFFLFSILNAFMNTYEYLHQLIQWIGVH